MSFRSLHPQFAPYAKWLYEYAQWAGHRPRITSLTRSFAEQARLYDRYLKGESHLPAAPPGRSLHNYGLAFDMVTRSANARMGSLWQGVGGRWGGETDPVHYDTGW